MSRTKENIWVGDHFGRVENRILILGESDYGEKKTITAYIRQWIRDRKNDHTFSRLLKIGVGKRVPSTSEGERRGYWDRVAFYNFAGWIGPDRKTRPGRKHFEKGCDVLPDVLASLRPRAVWILGKAQEPFSKPIVLARRDITLCMVTQHPAGWGVTDRELQRAWDKVSPPKRKIAPY